MEGRQSSGTVGIEVKGNKLRLRLPRAVSIDSSRYISTKWDSSPDNRRRLQVIAWQIEADIKTDIIAVTLQSYIDLFKSTKIAIKPPSEPVTLSQLWVKYCNYKQPQLAATTYTQDYCKKWANHIAQLPQELDKAVAIRDTLVAKVSLDTAKRLITLLTACCNWAVKDGLLTDNPFNGMASGLKRPKAEKTIYPFSMTERDSILLAFQEHPHHNHYYHFVEFLFLTGCRTGEAIALRWKHVAKDFSYITFSESYSSKLRVSKGTKTGKARRFPCNVMLKALLAAIKPSNAKPEQYVFTSPTGLAINNSKFTSQVWKGCRAGKKQYKGILPSLIVGGSVEAYRCIYNTRHTFITMMLEAGLTIPQVAKLVGNSPEIVLRHYAGSSVLEVPVV